MRDGRLWSANDEYRARGVPDDVVRHAADEQAAHRAAAVAPDDHEVDSLAPRGIDDRLTGISLPDQESHANPSLAAAGHELAGDELAVGAELVDPAGRVVRHGAVRRIDHAHDQQVPGEVAGQVQRLGRCPIGRG